jgi:hypothetical protein
MQREAKSDTISDCCRRHGEDLFGRLDARATAATEFRRAKIRGVGRDGGNTGGGDRVAVSRGAGGDGGRVGHSGRDRRQRGHPRRSRRRENRDRIGGRRAAGRTVSHGAPMVRSICATMAATNMPRAGSCRPGHPRITSADTSRGSIRVPATPAFSTASAAGINCRHRTTSSSTARAASTLPI